MYSAYGNTRLARRLVRLALYISGMVLFLSLCALCAQTANLLWLVVLMLATDIGVAVYVIKQGVLFEWRLERTWKAVCGGIGFKGVARSYMFGLYGAFVRGDTKTIYPKLREVCGDREAWTALVYPFAGQKVEEYNKHTDAFTLAFNVPFVSFEPTGTGIIKVRCGPVQVPETYEYAAQLVAPAQSSVLPAATAASVSEARYGLQTVPMARDIDGRPWYMPIEGNHVLIVGRTGAGKSSWCWSLVFGLAEARKAGLVRLWGLDPKKVELAYGMQWWDEYADTTESMVELLEKAVSELMDRNAAIQGKARKIRPSSEMPLNVIIIDELAYVSAMISDKKLLARAETAIKTILVLGRATGYVLVGCSQDPRKETLGFRDYFPTKVGLAMEAEMVDLVFGKGAHEAGANCEQIPLKEAGAGCAYVKEEMSNKPVLVRAAWCSDDDIKGMLAAVPAKPVQPVLDAGGTAQVEDVPSGQPDECSTAPAKDV